MAHIPCRVAEHITTLACGQIDDRNDNICILTCVFDVRKCLNMAIFLLALKMNILKLFQCLQRWLQLHSKIIASGWTE